jgi:PAS domain S-box-containing protein
MTRSGVRAFVLGKSAAAPLESDAIFRVLAETAASAIFIYMEDSFRYINPATEILTGYTRNELLKMPFEEIVHPDYRPMVRDRNQRRLRGDTLPLRYELKIITKNGEERWIDFSAGMIEYDGKIATLGTAFEITERKRVEQVQEAVYRIAQAADRAKRLDDLFPALHAIIAEVMTAQNFYIALYDEDDNLLSFPYFVDEVDAAPPPSRPGKGLTEYVLRTGKSALIDSFTHDELQRRGEVELVGEPSPIWLGVPLSVEGKVIGVMVVQHYSDPLAYGNREKRILEFVSSQVALVIIRKRSEDALRESEERYHRRADELAALYETTRDLSTHRDLTVLLNLVADRVISLLKSSGCSIYLYDHERDAVTAAIVRGWDSLVGTSLKMGEGVAGQVAKTLQSLVVNDYKSFSSASDKFAQVPVNAVAAVPMIYSGELVGVLTVFELDRKEKTFTRAYTDSEVNLLSVFAGTAASAVHNARLFEETRQRLLELEVLYEASLASAQIHSLNAAAQRVITTLEQLMHWQRGSIWAVDKEKNKPVLIALSNTGLSGDALQAEIARVDAAVPDLDHGVIGWVCTHGKTLRVPDVNIDPLYIETVPGTRSELCVPLQIGGRIIGCVNVESHIENAFSEHDERLLSTLAGQTAIAIENAQLYQDALRSAERRTVLYEASQEIARASQDPEQVYAAVHRAATRLMPCDAFVITLSDESHQEIHGVYLFDQGERHPNNVLPFGEGISGRIIATGQAIHTPDFASEGSGITPHVFGKSGRPRSMVAVPMRSGEKIIGMISAQNYKPNIYTADDVVLLETLAAYGGVAIENARLFDETRQRAARQAALNTIIMSATRASMDLDALLNIALDHTLRALQLDVGCSWLTPQSPGIPRFAVRGLSLIAGQDAAKLLNMVNVDFKHTDLVEDWSKDERSLARQVTQLGIGSSVAVPMLSDGQPIGSITVGSSQPRTWSPDEIALVEAVGREVGAAAERARLFEETRFRLAEQEGVVRISTALRQAQSLREILPRLIDETLVSLGADTGAIWLHDLASHRLKQAIGRGWCLGYADVDLMPDDGILGHVFGSSDIYFSRDVGHDPVSMPKMAGRIPDGWSAVCVPILVRQEPIGVLFISAPLPREFDPNDARLLVTVAEIAGNAIHRTRLHEQTERHAAELEARVNERTAELQEALDKAQAADRVKSEFIANVNHELRTPLTNLVLYYQMLRSQPTVRTEERLDVIGRELQRLRTLIEDLLNLSRLDQGQLQIRFHPHNINILVQTLVNDRRSLAEERRLTLTMDLTSGLPEVPVDSTLISQAISNLLTNALNYTPAGGEVNVMTTVATVEGKRRVGLSVQDNGPAIDPQDLPHLFDRFYRGKVGQASGAPGTGLGLAIVKQVVERHHGQIEVGPAFQDGTGVKFTIWLPVQQALDGS